MVVVVTNKGEFERARSGSGRGVATRQSFLLLVIAPPRGRQPIGLSSTAHLQLCWPAAWVVRWAAYVHGWDTDTDCREETGRRVAVAALRVVVSGPAVRSLAGTVALAATPRHAPRREHAVDCSPACLRYRRIEKPKSHC